MQRRRVLIGGIALTTVLASAPPQIHKEWILDRHLARDLEATDGRITDPAIVGYLQRIADRVAIANSEAALEIRLTRSSDPYAKLMPGRRVLYVAAGLLEHVESEGEMAGLFAHELAHAKQRPLLASQKSAIPVYLEACVLASQVLPTSWSEDLREPELQANTAAVGYLRAAGYDPSSVLDLFSKLAYDHPIWAKAIVADDLQRLRSEVEQDTLPPGGYVIDSSQFRQVRARLPLKK